MQHSNFETQLYCTTLQDQVPLLMCMFIAHVFSNEWALCKVCPEYFNQEKEKMEMLVGEGCCVCVEKKRVRAVESR